MSKPISDKRLDSLIRDWSRLLVSARTGEDRAFLSVMRELQRVRAAIREADKDVPIAAQHLPWWNKLIRATLPDSEK